MRGGALSVLIARAAVALAIVLAGGAALAHGASDGHLTLEVEGRDVRGRWDIALPDLERAVGIDGDGDGRVTWGELRARHDAIGAYVDAGLRLAADGAACPLAASEHLVAHRDHDTLAVVRFDARCPADPRRLELTYDLLFEADAGHRGLVRIVMGDATQAAVLGPDARRLEVVVEPSGATTTWVAAFVRRGIHELDPGADHVGLLLVLLLPAILRREGGRLYTGATGAGRPIAPGDVVRIVTTLAVAPATLLALTLLGVVRPPSGTLVGALGLAVVLAVRANFVPTGPGPGVGAREAIAEGGTRR